MADGSFDTAFLDVVRTLIGRDSRSNARFEAVRAVSEGVNVQADVARRLNTSSAAAKMLLERLSGGGARSLYPWTRCKPVCGLPL